MPGEVRAIHCCSRPSQKNEAWISTFAISAKRLAPATIPRLYLPRTVSRNTGGHLYHLDAMQQVSFPDTVSALRTHAQVISLSMRDRSIAS